MISISSSDTTLAKLLESGWSVAFKDDDASGEGDNGKVWLVVLFLFGRLDCAFLWRFLLVGIVGVLFVVEQKKKKKAEGLSPQAGNLLNNQSMKMVIEATCGPKE